MGSTNNQFKIDLPSGWEDQTVHLFMGPDDSGVQHMMQLSIDTEIDGAELEEYARGRIDAAMDALQGADVVVLTSDNPRGEDPDAIIADALRPLAGQLPLVASDNELGATERGYWVQSNRAEAIAAAVRALRAGDILLVAGKGHEDYQIVGDCRHHFDDREQVRQALARRR